MNELIKQLANRAGMAYTLSKPVHIAKDGTHIFTEHFVYDNFDLDKFAELIVKECTEIFWTNECSTSDLAYVDYLNKCRLIKQNFGV